MVQRHQIQASFYLRGVSMRLLVGAGYIFGHPLTVNGIDLCGIVQFPATDHCSLPRSHSHCGVVSRPARVGCI